MAQIQKENLISQVPQDRATRPAGFYFSIVFDVLSVASALAAGFFYASFLGGGSALWLAAAAAVFMALAVVQVILPANQARRMVVAGLGALALIAPSWNASPNLLAACAAILLLFFFWGSIMGRWQFEDSLEMHFFRTSHLVLAKTTTALILAGLVLYIPHWSPSNVFFSEQSFDGLFAFSARFANQFYPEINFSSTFGDFAESIARDKYGGDLVYRSLPPAKQAQVLADASVRVGQQLSSGLGISVQPGDRLSAVFFELLSKNMNNLYARTGPLFIAGWLIAAFFFLRGFGMIVYWAVGLLAFLIYQALIGLHVVRVVGENATRETVEYAP